MALPPDSRQNVAVLIDPSDSWGRRVILGISTAVRNLLPWDLLICPQDDQWRYRIPKSWKGDGLIVEVRDDQSAQHVRSLGLPVVHTSLCEKTQDSVYRVITDDRQRAELAFEHFRERGFRNFAYYGPRNQRYPETRGAEFEKIVHEAGFKCSLFLQPFSHRDSNAVRTQTRRWIQQLPQPVAVLTADPHPALLLSQICQAANLHIPEQIAILAGDSDDLLCEIADPPLSSIQLGCEQIGIQSVQMLMTLLSGNEPDVSHVLIPPVRVQERQSTDVLAIKDENFSQALRFIRAHAHRGIQVTDVLRHVPMSRRVLEQRFAQHLMRSPAEEIRRVKLELAKHLLTTTDQSVEQIAQASGFSGASQLGVVFRKINNITPIEYRKACRYSQ